MGSVVMGNVQKAQAFLTQHGIIVPTSNIAILNLYEFITQPNVTRNKIPEEKRIAELKQAQARWLNCQVNEKGTGKRGTVRFITVRRGTSDCFYATGTRGPVFVAVVDWQNGGCHRGMSVNQLTPIESQRQASS